MKYLIIMSSNIQNSQESNKGKEAEQQYMKEDEDVQDVQYLEDFGEVSSENGAQQNISGNTNAEVKDPVTIPATDPESLLNEAYFVNTASNKRRPSSYACSFCGKNYMKLKTLRAHIKNSHQQSEQPYACNQCKESFNSEHDLKLHSALHPKGSMWKCNKCEKEFHSKSMLRRHIQRHMESKRYACETCGKLFIELYALRRHTRVHTGELVEKKHKCHLCDKRYRWSAQLSAHVARHAGARPCACACGKSFPTPRLLASHQRVHDDRKPHACHYCDKRFRHESTRNTHHRTHTGEKPYVCCTCGKAFIQNSNLTLHMRTHTGEKPYSCSMCWRKFSSSSTLKAHLRSHTGERPYECKICGKRFARVPLQTHMRLHTGERPHRCSACPKTFVNASRLREHAHVHTGEKPFECAMCAQMFPTKSHLVKHLKTHQPQKKSKRVVVCNPEILVSNKIVISENTSTIEGLKSETVRAEDTACRIVILDSEQAPIEVHLSC
ncbi:zinc finger protein 664 isoform X2 [Manduca sexta]|uniref:zinc finger protein 664 isoform X2 n=1 Tax=Manduca sexta TaxID=7130 RepID=UPI00188E520F|nr:zinc finger protein 664 isoform X2 [Manduca sexta]